MRPRLNHGFPSFAQLSRVMLLVLAISQSGPAPCLAAESTPPQCSPVSNELKAPGYWVVSTENSPQSFDDYLPQFCASVRRYDHCTGIRSSSLTDLQTQLIPGVPICIMVHGSFMDSPSVVPESFRTWNWLKHGAAGRPFQMIYFRWPSYRLPSPLINIDVAILGRRASRNGFYLASFLKQLPHDTPVTLVGHSHGTRVISAAAHLMAGGTVEDIQCPELACSGRPLRAVFAASAIDHDWLNPGERFDRALCSIDCLLNLRNQHDLALMVYPLRRIASRAALGSVGLTRSDRAALGSRSAQVQEINVSADIGFRHFWPSYTEEYGIARRAANYLFWLDQSQ